MSLCNFLCCFQSLLWRCDLLTMLGLHCNTSVYHDSTRDYGITYLFHDRRVRANRGLRTSQSTGHASVAVGYGTFSLHTLCWEIGDTSRSRNKVLIMAHMAQYTYIFAPLKWTPHGAPKGAPNFSISTVFCDSNHKKLYTLTMQLYAALSLVVISTKLM